MANSSVRNVGVNTNLNRVNYIEWLDCSHYQDEFFGKDEFNPRVVLITSGFVYNDTPEYVSSALNYMENNKTAGIIHIPTRMILHRKELLLKKISLKKPPKVPNGSVLVVRVKFVDASKSYAVPNGVMPTPGITCWVCGILAKISDGVATVVQDWSPQSGSFREIFNIPEVCIQEVYGATQKITRQSVDIMNEK